MSISDPRHDHSYITRTPERPGDDDPYGEEISLRPMVRTLWSYRRVIARTVAAAFIAIGIIALSVLVLTPAERKASVEFRLVFDGADNGEYPNGLRFSRSEIIAPTVLFQVYEANELSRYCTFDEFKNSFYILEASKEQELLNYEFASKLADTKLSPVDRARVEEEFRQRRDALRVAQYSLNFMAPSGQAEIPSALLSKALNDVLATWAEDAASRRGVLKYQINVLSANVLPQELVNAEDYIIRLDILRGKIIRILQNLDDLARLPGASVQRVGESRISIAEVRANLSDVLRYQAEPLIGMIRATGVSRDPVQLMQYLENRLFQVRLEKDEAQRRVAVIQDSLTRYMLERGGMAVGRSPGDGSQQPNATAPMPGTAALIPQFGESFIDRLVELSTQNNDVRYRQELTDRIIESGQSTVTLEREATYYESLLDSIRRLPAAASRRESVAADTQLIETRLAGIQNAILRSLEQSSALYEQLSKHNLNPRTNLYSLVGPYSITTQRALTTATLGMYGLLAFVASVILVPLGCLVHNYFRQEGFLKERPRRAVAPAPPPETIDPGARPPAPRETPALVE